MKSRLDLEIDIIPGIGPKKKTVYNKLGIKTIKDLFAIISNVMYIC